MSAIETAPDRVIPPKRRLFLILFVVTALAGLNMLVGRVDIYYGVLGSEYILSLAIRVALVLFYIFQVAFVSYFCGKSDDPTWLKWTVFAWIFVMIDLQILARVPRLGVNGDSLAFVSLFASQFGLLTTWLVMGSTHIVKRVSITVLPLVCLWMLFVRTDWSLLFPCLVIPLFVVLVILRIFQFRLMKSDMGKSDVAASRQFSLAHAMMLTTVLAVVMAGLKSQESLLTQIAGSVMDNESPIGIILVLGFSSAITAVSACWAALGYGRPQLRYGVLVLVVTLAGVGVSLWANAFMAKFWGAGGWRARGMSRLSYELVMFAEAGWLWLGWYVSSGLLLVASLWFLRCQGLRFLRSAKDS